MFYETNSDKTIDVRVLHMDKHQVEHTVDQIFGCGNTIKISRFMQKLLEELPGLRKGERIKTYSFLNFALFDYYRCRRQTDRAVSAVKNADQVAGISAKKLNREQVLQGINKRLAKGRGQGLQAHELLAALNLFGDDGDNPFAAFGAETTPTKPVEKNNSDE